MNYFKYIGLTIATVSFLGCVHNIPKNDLIAFQKTQKSCELNNGSACHHLGELYYNGKGVAKNILKAKKAFQKSCNLNNGKGCGAEGYYYYVHEKENMFKSKALFEKSCNLNSGEGCTLLASIYAMGRGVPKDMIKAQSIYKKACNLGEKNGCNGLRLAEKVLLSNTDKKEKITVLKEPRKRSNLMIYADMAQLKEAIRIQATLSLGKASQKYGGWKGIQRNKPQVKAFMKQNCEKFALEKKRQYSHLDIYEYTLSNCINLSLRDLR